MKILSLEAASVSASVCLTEDEKLVAQSFWNCGLTHSRTLLPMTEQILGASGLRIADLDGIAVSAGPGSFTGTRIGVATVKGLAFGANLPCVGVSTLEAMAWNLLGQMGDVCCVMDARAGQVYNARFRMTADGPARLCDDRAIPIEVLAEEIGESEQIFIGDGAEMCYTKLKDTCPRLTLAPPHLRFPTGYGVARAALALFRAGKTLSAQEIDAVYLRAPQAEQERMKKLLGGNTK